MREKPGQKQVTNGALPFFKESLGITSLLGVLAFAPAQAPQAPSQAESAERVASCPAEQTALSHHQLCGRRYSEAEIRTSLRDIKNSRLTALLSEVPQLVDIMLKKDSTSGTDLVDEIFKSLDTNNDGILYRSELEQACEQIDGLVLDGKSFPAKPVFSKDTQWNQECQDFIRTHWESLRVLHRLLPWVESWG